MLKRAAPMTKAKREVEKAARRTVEAAGASVEAGREAVDEVIAEARHDVEKHLHDTAERVESLRDGLHGRYDHAVEVVREGYATTAKSAEDLAADCRAYVSDNPGRCLLAATAGGVLLGLLLGRQLRPVR